MNAEQKRLQTKLERAILDVGNAYNEVCPELNRGTIGRLVSDLRTDGTDNLTILRQATGRLYDGLAYGNW